MNRQLPSFLRIATEDDWQPTGSLVLTVEPSDTLVDVIRKSGEALDWVTRPLVRPSLWTRLKSWFAAPC